MSTVTLTETAELLGCTRRNVRMMVRKGWIKPVYPRDWKKKTEMCFRPEDVAALAEVRKENISLTKLAGIAYQAHVSMRSLERQVERLMHVVGATVPTLPTDEASVVALHIKAEDHLAEDPLILSAQEVLEWGKVFYNMGEEYFEVVLRHTGDQEPWKKYLDLASRIYENAPQAHVDAEREEAYKYFAIGRRFMRQAAYFYVHTYYGRNTASQMFPETKSDIDERVIQMAFD